MLSTGADRWPLQEREMPGCFYQVDRLSHALAFFAGLGQRVPFIFLGSWLGESE